MDFKMTTEAEIALVIWVNDRPIQGGVICMTDIHSPRKELKDYRTGDKVMAVCRGFKGYHECIIAKIAEKSCKAQLCKQLDGARFIEILQSFDLFQASESKGDTSIPEIHKHPLDGKDETNNRQNKKQKTVSQKRRPSKKAGNSEKNLVNIANDLELMELKKYVDSTMTVSDGSMANDHNQSSVIAANGRTVDGTTEHTTDVPEVDERNNGQTFGTVFGESLRVLQGSSNEDLLEEKDCCPCKHMVTALDAENKNLQTKCQSLEYEIRNIWSWIHHLNQRNVDQRNQPSSFASFLNESVQDTPDVLVERQAESSNRIVCPGLTKTYGGYTKSQLEAEIEGISDFSKAAKKLFRFLYTYKEYIGKTLTGGKANSKYQTRPPLQDQSRIQIIYEIIKEKYSVGEVMVRHKLRDLLKPSRVPSLPETTEN